MFSLGFFTSHINQNKKYFKKLFIIIITFGKKKKIWVPLREKNLRSMDFARSKDLRFKSSSFFIQLLHSKCTIFVNPLSDND